jgi:hypothetical protein
MITLVNTLMVAVMFGLSPSGPYPDPVPFPNDPPVQLLPTYTTNADGTRMQCTPALTYCWPDTTGLPSYLTGS